MDFMPTTAELATGPVSSDHLEPEIRNPLLGLWWSVGELARVLKTLTLLPESDRQAMRDCEKRADHYLDMFFKTP